MYNFRGKARKHIVKSWNSLVKGNEMPALPPKDERFNREVAFVEATTESISQFTLGNVIVRIFGISDDPTSKALQYFSLATSTLSLSLAFVTVSDPETLLITQQRSKFGFLSASNVSQAHEDCKL